MKGYNDMNQGNWQRGRDQKLEVEIERITIGFAILSFVVMFCLVMGLIIWELFGEISLNTIGLTVFGILIIFITSYIVGRWIVR